MSPPETLRAKRQEAAVPAVPIYLSRAKVGLSESHYVRQNQVTKEANGNLRMQPSQGQTTMEAQATGLVKAESWGIGKEVTPQNIL